MTCTDTLTVGVFHPTNSRPHAPELHWLLMALNDEIRHVATGLGWQCDVIASAEVGLTAALTAARRADVIIIVGGEDVAPCYYGAESLAGLVTGPPLPQADAVDIAVIQDAAARRTPMLGICRGHQLINVALGGTLNQHLDHPHRCHGDQMLPDTPFVSTPLLSTKSASSDLELALELPPSARCTHHQAISQLAPGLEVAARAPDGVIEAVIHSQLPITGVQFHPEHPDFAAHQLTPLLLRLRDQARELTVPPSLRTGRPDLR